MYNSDSPTIHIHTDLALEDTEQFPSADPKQAGQGFRGIEVTKHRRFNDRILITRVEVKTAEAAEAIGKPVGVYLTLEAEDLREPEDDIVHAVAKELAKQLLLFFRHAGEKAAGASADLSTAPAERSTEESDSDKDSLPHRSSGHRLRSILIIGLGNREITADALGPKVSEFLNATRHIKERRGIGVSTLAPGVMAQTGMESADIIRGVVKETQPDLLLVIDALASRSTSRFRTTIQLSDSGIAPGSGVGNHRTGITQETLGIPVLAIGVPTVVDAATIVSDAVDRMLAELEAASKDRETRNSFEGFRGMSHVFLSFSPGEKYRLIQELLHPAIGRMDVTPKDIDETVQIFAELITEAIEMAVAAYE
ncbi:MAG: GPR endopeptidase [Lachnospiraceae bacterium]|nr:GPR endopeptidase [Lachnospiraceae bacterium]